MIRATCHSDDRVVEVEFDATPWFAQASDDDIKALAKCEWGGDYPADDVARFMEVGNAQIGRMFTHIDNLSGTRNAPGFECNVMEDWAMEWIKKNRPQLYEAMCAPYYDNALNQEAPSGIGLIGRIMSMIPRLLAAKRIAAARGAGWRIDHDGWWTRPMRSGEQHFDISSIGFTMDEENHEVFVRTAADALDYDARLIPATG